MELEDKNYYPILFNPDGNEFKIQYSGTAPTPCVLTIIPKVDCLNLEVRGLTEVPFFFKGLKANQVLEINGENRTVTVDSVNAIERFDGWEFPKLMPGENVINIDNGMAMAISIEYNTNYI